MRSIKLKILTSFCLLALGVIALMVAVVSFKLDSSISQQSQILVKNRQAETGELLKGHLQIFLDTVHEIQKDVSFTAKSVVNNETVSAFIEKNYQQGLVCSREMI